jgi:hypothetical protein
MHPKVIIDTYEAVGGLAKAVKAPDGYVAGPTDAGEYVVAYCGKHTSAKVYRYWSGVPWGASIRERRGQLEVYVSGRWQSLSLFTPATKEAILNAYFDLYGRRELPKTWVFNDFGHQTCYFFKDVNKNLKLDGKEHIHREFIHPTPSNEAQTERGNPVILFESHGCIHVKPKDIDEMIRKGYLKAGNKIFVHSYLEKEPVRTRGNGHPPYELHFYPGSKNIVVEGTK